MFGFLKRLKLSAPKVLGAEESKALDESGATEAGGRAGDELKRQMNAKEKGFRCPKNHPLFAGQRPEDCFDCFLIGTMATERNGLVGERPEAQLIGTLLCLNGFHRGASFPIMLAEDVPLTVGAEPDCDIVLSDERISRRHISMVRRQSRTTIRDLNSLHHSAMRAEGELQWYVLDPEREYWFRDGCHLMLGDIEFLFRAVDEQSRKLSAAAG